MKRVVLARAVWEILGVRGIVDFLSVRGLRSSLCRQDQLRPGRGCVWCEVTKGIQDFLRPRGLRAACVAQISFGAKSVAMGGRSWEWAETGVAGTLDGCLGGV